MLLIVAATEGELLAAHSIEGVDTLVCGVGPVDAAANVARRLAERPSIVAVLHIGIAGCRRGSGHALGDMVVGDESVYCDTQSPLVTTSLQPSRDMVRHIVTSCGYPQCAIGTSARVGGTTGCDIEAMEGFGVLRAASMAGIPAVEVRCVSNEIEEPDRSRWDFSGAIERLQQDIARIVAALTGVEDS